MIVETTIACRADVLPPRARLTRKGVVHETVAVRVREVPAAEAPVVLRPKDRRGVRFDVRLHGGLLWRVPDPNPEEDGHTVDVSPTAAVAGIAWETGIDVRALGSTRGGRVPPVDARTVSSQRDLVAAVCQERADAALLVVDGVVHHRARSPLVAMADIRGGWGLAAAERAEAVMRTSHEPAWFAVRLREILAATPQSVDRMCVRILGLLDVEIVRPDLMEGIAGEAACCDPKDVLNLLRAQFAFHQSPHASLTQRAAPENDRSFLMRRIMQAVFEDEAARGADFAQAVAAAQAVLAPLPAEDRDVFAILDEPDPAAPLKLEQFWFASAGGRPFDPQWSISGRNPDRTQARLVVLSAEEQREVAFAGSGRYVRDGAGAFHWDPTWAERGTGKLRRDGSIVKHAMDIAPEAWRLSERSEKAMPRADHLGAAIRHPEGMRKLLCDSDKATVLTEFAEARIALLGRRMVWRCPEPVFVVQPDDGTKNPVRPHVGHSHSIRIRPGDRPPFFFRLDRRDEALAFAGRCGKVDPSGLTGTRILDADLLRFDDGLWNLRAAARRIALEMDRRVVLMRPEALRAFSRMEKHLEAWCADGSLVSTDAHVEDFLADAAVVLAEIESPIFDDVGPDHVREIARTSLARALETRRIAEPAMEEEYGDFSM